MKLQCPTCKLPMIDAERPVAQWNGTAYAPPPNNKPEFEWVVEKCFYCNGCAKYYDGGK